MQTKDGKLLITWDERGNVRILSQSSGMGVFDSAIVRTPDQADELATMLHVKASEIRDGNAQAQGNQPAGTAPGETSPAVARFMKTVLDLIGQQEQAAIVSLVREHYETARAMPLGIQDEDTRPGWQARAAALREVLESIPGTPEAEALAARARQADVEL